MKRQSQSFSHPLIHFPCLCEQEGSEVRAQFITHTRKSLSFVYLRIISSPRRHKKIVENAFIASQYHHQHHRQYCYDKKANDAIQCTWNCEMNFYDEKFSEKSHSHSSTSNFLVMMQGIKGEEKSNINGQTMSSISSHTYAWNVCS